MAVPSLILSGDKIMLRRRAREERRTFVGTLDAGARSALEKKLADALDPLLANCRTLGAYAPLPDEISPIPAAERARANGATIAFPAFTDRQATFRFLAGDPSQTGPFGILQPPPDAPEMTPDLILLPLVAVDRAFNRLGQGKGHYDRILPDFRRRGALLIGVGWAMQLLDDPIEAEAWDVVLDGFASPNCLEMRR